MQHGEFLLRPLELCLSFLMRLVSGRTFRVEFTGQLLELLTRCCQLGVVSFGVQVRDELFRLRHCFAKFLRTTLYLG